MHFTPARPHGCNINGTARTLSTFIFILLYFFALLRHNILFIQAYLGQDYSRFVSKSHLSPTLRSFLNSDDKSSLIIRLLSRHQSVFIQVLYLKNGFTWPWCYLFEKTAPWVCSLKINIITYVAYIATSVIIWRTVLTLFEFKEYNIYFIKE